MEMIRANLDGGPQDGVNLMVIHGTVSPDCYCGAAKDLGEYFSNLESPANGGRWASAHYGFDPCNSIQYLPDDVVAYHAPPNHGTLGYELCDAQEGPESRWDDDDHQAMMQRAADTVRAKCEEHDVPMVWLFPDDLKAGKRGITDHENVSWAFGQTSHSDPGWSVDRSDEFMAMVRGEKEAPKPSGGGGAAPAPKPKPRLTVGDLENPNDFPLKRHHWFGDIKGGAKSHGGFYEWEQSYVKHIQQALILKGYVPGVSNAQSPWADGKFESPWTTDAVVRFQRAERPNSTSLWGQVWFDDWHTLFS